MYYAIVLMICIACILFFSPPASELLVASFVVLLPIPLVVLRADIGRSIHKKLRYCHSSLRPDSLSPFSFSFAKPVCKTAILFFEPDYSAYPRVLRFRITSHHSATQSAQFFLSSIVLLSFYPSLSLLLQISPDPDPRIPRNS
ncbi:hypothetical protein GGR51DRAFT_55180 [Nemania sp. FL0031]|nr:hypothetical protein GGR51DRAFT_55180 [Nemania sp. FL0031]